MKTGRKPREWTDEELNILKAYPHFSTLQIAEKIGVTGNTVRRKLKQLGTELRSYKGLRDWTSEDLALCARYPKLSIETLAGLIGVDKKTVRRKLEAMGMQIISRRNGQTALQAE